jgi:NAD(P) transhydrogenase subunit alpha
MNIGILKEINGENRVSLLPEAIGVLKKMNLNVIIETGAGERSFATDQQYTEAGAEIKSKEEVISKAELFLAINSPDETTLAKFRKGQVIIAAFNPYFNPVSVQKMAGIGITAFSLDIIPRTTRAQTMDILSSMATVAGYKAVLTAANLLPKFFPMFMTAAGTITPAKILILGAGVAGLQAIATSRKLGGVVEVFDVRAAVKEEVIGLGAKFVEVEGATDDKSAGGYAVEQSDEFKKKQAQAIHDHAIKSDVVICTAQIPGRNAPLLLRTETVDLMKNGAVIIDLAASTGGNCELSKNNETIIHNGVKIVGNSFLPSEMPSDASKMFGKNLVNFLKLIVDAQGNLQLNWEDDLVAGTLLCHGNEVKNERVLSALNQ